MNYDKITAILRTMAILDAMTDRVGHWRLGEIAQWSCIPRATCDRYLKVMVQFNLIDMQRFDEGKFGYRLFSLNDDGRELIRVFTL